MKIHGREIKFLRTVKATSDIAKLCPENDIERIGELFAGDLPKTLETGAKIICYLNEGYEFNRAFDDPNYEPRQLTFDEVMYLDDQTYTALMNDAMKGMSNGTETMIETEVEKKPKNINSHE